MPDPRSTIFSAHSERSKTFPSIELTRQDRLLPFISRNWIWFFGLLFGLYVVSPFLAPLFMQLGWPAGGRGVYLIYSFLCHQLPERSFFFFGPKATYSLAEIQASWAQTRDPMILRQFVGNPEMGWKVAWSDRMVSMYTSIWIFGLFWWPVRKRFRKLPWWGLFFFLLPMVIDGTTHFISDLAGLGLGFRDNNDWLASLTQHSLTVSFYAGNALGSFNSWARLLTGTLFGAGIVWFSFPYVDEAMSTFYLPPKSRYSFSQGRDIR